MLASSGNKQHVWDKEKHIIAIITVKLPSFQLYCIDYCNASDQNMEKIIFISFSKNFIYLRYLKYEAVVFNRYFCMINFNLTRDINNNQYSFLNWPSLRDKVNCIVKVHCLKWSCDPLSYARLQDTARERFGLSKHKLGALWEGVWFCCVVKWMCLLLQKWSFMWKKS